MHKTRDYNEIVYEKVKKIHDYLMSKYSDKIQTQILRKKNKLIKKTIQSSSTYNNLINKLHERKQKDDRRASKKVYDHIIAKYGKDSIKNIVANYNKHENNKDNNIQDLPKIFQKLTIVKQ